MSRPSTSKIVGLLLRVSALAARAFILMAAGAQALTAAPGDTLAVVGRRVILAEEFVRRYQEKVRSVGLTDNVETRRQYLRNLIDDAILIENARRLGLDSSPAAQSELERLKTQELLTAYVVDHLKPTIRVTEDDLRTLYVRLNTRLRVRHLYARTAEGAHALAVALAAGRSFDELARECFNDPWLSEHGGSLGFMTVEEMDPEFERVAYSLRVGEISGPVRTSRGYSIIRVDDIVVNPLHTETEFANARERLGRFARARALEQSLKQLTGELRTRLRVTFDASLMARLYGARQLDEDAVAEHSRMSPKELASAAVASTDGIWTLERVMDELSRTPERHRRWVHSQEDLEDMIAGLVIRKHVCAKARKLGLHAAAEYRAKVEFGFDSYLLEQMESQWKGELRFTADSVRSYYSRHRQVFQSPAEVRLAGILLDRPSSADSVKAALDRGEAFAEVARRHSIQRATAERGGDMGTFRRDQLGRLGTDFMTLKDGEWKGPFEDEGRLLFVRRLGGKPGTIRPLAECESEVRAILTAAAWPEHRRRNIDRALQDIPMEWRPEHLPSLNFSERVQ